MQTVVNPTPGTSRQHHDKYSACRSSWPPPLGNCFRELLSHADSRERTAAAGALLAANASQSIDDEYCDAPEDINRLRSRGFAVLRGVVPHDVLATLNISEQCWTDPADPPLASTGPVQPIAVEGGPEVRRRGFQDPTEVAQRPELLNLIPKLVRLVRRRLASVATNGYPGTRGAALRPVSGEFFRVDPNLERLRANNDTRSAALHGARALDWHNDIEHMLWLMLDRSPINTFHSGLVAAPDDRVARVCALANDRNVRQQARATREMRRYIRSAARAAAREDAITDPVHRAKVVWQTCDTMHPSRLFEHAACRKLRLRPGDGLLLLPGAYHRTSDYVRPRTAVTFDLCVDEGDGQAHCSIEREDWLQG